MNVNEALDMLRAGDHENPAKCPVCWDAEQQLASMRGLLDMQAERIAKLEAQVAAQLKIIDRLVCERPLPDTEVPTSPP